MTRIFAVRAKAIEQLTAPTFSTNGVWNAGVWDGQKYNLLEGTLYVNASCQLTIYHAQQSGDWDFSESWYATSGQGIGFTTSLRGRYITMRLTAASGLTPSTCRLGSWGKESDSLVEIEPVRAMKPASLLKVTGASAGVALSLGKVKAVIVKALVANSGNIFMGGNAPGDYPYSGYGYLLEPGESLSLDVDDFSRLAVFANVSGDRITYAGVH